MRTLALALLLLVTGCGNLVDPPVLAGTAGVAVEDGQPVVLLARCDDRVVEVAVHAAVDHEASPDAENPLLGRWTQTAPGDVTRLVLAAPGPEWQPRTGLAASDGEVVVSVSVVGVDDEILTGVTVTRSQLDAIGPDEVLTNGGIVATGDLEPVCD